MEENETAKVTIVIPVHNRRQYTLNCLKQLQSIDKDGMDITTVVVDDGSTDGTSEKIAQEYPEVVLLHGNGSLWWSGSTNMGVEYALKHNSDYILTLNDDTMFRNDFLMYMLKTVQSYKNTICCGAFCDVDDKNNTISGGRFAKELLGHNVYSSNLFEIESTALHEKEFEISMGTGCAMLIPRKIFQQVGLFDAIHFPHHKGDFDFLLRARKKGFKILVNPRAILHTKIGDNYFHFQIIKEPLWNIIKSFFHIKSTINLRTRWNFYWKYTPYCLGWFLFLFFLIRMYAAILCKMILPTKILIRIMSKRAYHVKRHYRR